jgi:hypothetical protein
LDEVHELSVLEGCAYSFFVIYLPVDCLRKVTLFVLKVKAFFDVDVDLVSRVVGQLVDELLPL